MNGDTNRSIPKEFFYKIEKFGKLLIHGSYDIQPTNFFCRFQLKKGLKCEINMKHLMIHRERVKNET